MKKSDVKPSGRDEIACLLESGVWSPAQTEATGRGPRARVPRPLTVGDKAELARRLRLPGPRLRVRDVDIAP